MIEITTVEGFRKFKSTEGYFIITDTNGRKVHSNRCVAVDVSNFREKVIDNSNRSGRYFFTDNFLEALQYPKVKKCEECRRML